MIGKRAQSVPPHNDSVSHGGFTKKFHIFGQGKHHIVPFPDAPFFINVYDRVYHLYTYYYTYKKYFWTSAHELLPQYWAQNYCFAFRGLYSQGLPPLHPDKGQRPLTLAHKTILDGYGDFTFQFFVFVIYELEAIHRKIVKIRNAFIDNQLRRFVTRVL